MLSGLKHFLWDVCTYLTELLGFTFQKTEMFIVTVKAYFTQL
jgi:phage-related minor tail protein